MVQHGAVERLGSVSQATRRTEVAVARARIAARMIVREDDPRAAVRGSVDDDLPNRKFAAALVTLVRGDVEAPGLVVDMSDPQMLRTRVLFREATSEEFARSSKAVELQRKIGTLVPPDISLSGESSFAISTNSIPE